MSSDTGATITPLELETAQQHLCRNVPVLAPGATVGEARAGIVGKSFEFAGDLAVCDGPRLVGLLTIEALLAAADDVRVRDVMDPDPPVAHRSEDQRSRHGRPSSTGSAALR